MKDSKLKNAVQIYAQMQTEMSRGPLAEDEHSRKEIVEGGLWQPPTIFFLPWSASAFPIAFLFAFVHGLVGQPFTCWNAVMSVVFLVMSDVLLAMSDVFLAMIYPLRLPLFTFL